MIVAATEAFVSPLAMNQTKDAMLDLSLNHERLLEENHRVRNLLSKSEALVQAYQRRDAAGRQRALHLQHPHLERYFLSSLRLGQPAAQWG
jgi:hypothetical protein